MSTDTAPAAVEESAIALAERMADAAAEITRRHFRGDFAVEGKEDRSPVTIADREAEMALRTVLGDHRPDDGVIGEEFGVERGDARDVWVLDPIDGTRAFITGKPTFGTLIALVRDGRPVLGVIDQPIVGDRWVGAAGHPTRHNGRPVTTRTCGNFAAAYASTTGPHLFASDSDLAAFERVADRVRDTVYGMDCYAYGLLASGHLDLVIESGLKIHDFAALVPVVEGAGGAMRDWTGRPLTAESSGRVLALGDPSLLDATLALLGEA
ncbi:MAG: histidinol-phosphatase [Azospirillaceae bacterium]